MEYEVKEHQHDLFNPLWEKKIHKRIYYKATASNGSIALRGSWQDKYNYACIRLETEYLWDNQLSYASFHNTRELAQRATNYGNKHTDMKFECVELERISAKEFNMLSRLNNKNKKKYIQARYQELMHEHDQQLTTTGGN